MRGLLWTLAGAATSTSVAVAAAAGSSRYSAAPAATCLGEFQLCASGECTLFACDGPGPHCGAGEYRCPISNACVKGVAGYEQCPGLTGTHLDHTLDTEARVTKLIALTNLTDQISQLTNKAPALEHVSTTALAS
jgi:beta-glucosidase